MTKRILISAILLGASLSGALAASPQYCEEYANQAVISATQNKERGCGYQGGRWGFNYAVHFNWCRTVSPSAAMSERLTRKYAIQGCQG